MTGRLQSSDFRDILEVKGPLDLPLLVEIFPLYGHEIVSYVEELQARQEIKITNLRGWEIFKELAKEVAGRYPDHTRPYTARQELADLARMNKETCVTVIEPKPTDQEVPIAPSRASQRLIPALIARTKRYLGYQCVSPAPTVV